MKTISMFVGGIPKAQPRSRSTSKHRGVYNPHTADAWKIQIKHAFRLHANRLLEGPIICDIIFLIPRPKRLMRKKDPTGRIPYIVKPDRDNLDKSFMDCLSGKIKKKKGKKIVLVGGIGLWVDDCQVYSGKIEKYYCAIEENPGAIVKITYEDQDR